MAVPLIPIKCYQYFPYPCFSFFAYSFLICAILLYFMYYFFLYECVFMYLSIILSILKVFLVWDEISLKIQYEQSMITY